MMRQCVWVDLHISTDLSTVDFSTQTQFNTCHDVCFEERLQGDLWRFIVPLHAKSLALFVLCVEKVSGGC